MRSPSLNRLYAKINKHILLAQAYTEIKDLAFIIKICRLKPYSFIFEGQKKLILHKWWFDEFGNSLKITKNKKIKIIYNDLSLPKDKIICSDLYYGLSLEKINKISKLLYVYVGKDEETLQNYFIISFLGIDNYLRTFIRTDDEWQQVSSLILGFEALQKITKNVNIKYFTEVLNKENNCMPCVKVKEWISYVPVNKIFLQIIKKQYDTAFNFLIEDYNK